MIGCRAAAVARDTSARRRRASVAWIGIALLAIALNLRIAIVAVAPVVEEIRLDTAMSRGAAGLLGTIPVLCMGVFSFAGPWLLRRSGEKALVTWAIVLIAAGTLVRAAMPTGSLMIAITVPIGIGIALSGFALPVVVKRSFPRSGGAVTGAYVAMQSVGAAATVLGVVALARVLGGWREAFAVTAVPALLALAAWAGSGVPSDPVGRRALRSASCRSRASVRARVRSLLPSAIALRLAMIFGCQSICWAAVITWLPALYGEAGWSAADAAWATATVPLVTIVSASLVPGLSDGRDRRAWIVAAAAVMTLAIAGLAFALTVAPLLWPILFGLGNGALFPLSLTLPIDLSEDEREIATLTAWTLGLGFLIAAPGPVLVGALRDATGGFTLGLVVVAALGTVCGFLATGRALRPRQQGVR